MPHIELRYAYIRQQVLDFFNRIGLRSREVKLINGLCKQVQWLAAGDVDTAARWARECGKEGWAVSGWARRARPTRAGRRPSCWGACWRGRGRPIPEA